LSPWKGCAPFCGRSWMVIFNTTLGSSAISRKSDLRPCFARGGSKLTTRANAFCNLSVTHLNNDTASHLGLGDSRRGFLVPQRDLPHRYLAECRGDPAQVRHRSRNWGQSLTLRSDLPLPGDPTGGSIIRPKSAAGHASRLGLYHHPHTSQGSRPAGGLVRATPARSAVVAGPSASPERGRVAGPAYPTRAFSHLSHERHRGRPHRAASSA